MNDNHDGGTANSAKHEGNEHHDDARIRRAIAIDNGAASEGRFPPLRRK